MTAGRIWRAADRHFAPWKNGGGETAEILCWPENAGIDDFDWRISTARVDRSGPFSVFPGVDRVLTVLAGGTMTLVFDDGGRIVAGPDSGPHGFPGDLGCAAVLAGDGLLDLNLMVRRPLRGAVHLPGARLTPRGRCALYLFACTDLPDLQDLPDLPDLPAPGLVRHDLIALAPDRALTVPPGALALCIGRE